MTYNFKPNDHKMAAYIMGKTMEIARAANAKIIGNPQLRNNFDSMIGGSSHHTGGAIIGVDPKTSVINRYLQSWDATMSWAARLSRRTRAPIPPRRSGRLPIGPPRQSPRDTSNHLGLWCAREESPRRQALRVTKAGNPGHDHPGQW